MCSSGNSAGNAAADARRAEEARQAQVTEATGRINDTFSRFNDGFYAKRGAEYSDYALPQVQDQYANARNTLAYSLADAGLTRSSVAAKRLGDLEREYALRKLDVADQARAYAQQVQGDVEGARSSLVTQAAATGDAALAGNQAISDANRLATSGPAFSPIGTLFQNVAAGIGTVRAAQQSAALQKAIGASVYQPTASSSRVVN